MVHTNYRTIVCCIKYRIARTYLQHTTRPHTKYKQHTPNKLQKDCIATIQQIQNHGKNNTHIILHTKYRKNSFYYTKYRTLQHHCKDLCQIQDTQCSKIQTEHCSIQICPYQCRNLHLIVVVVCWFSAVPWLCVSGMNGMLSLGCIVFDQDRPLIAYVNPPRHWIVTGSAPYPDRWYHTGLHLTHL